MPTANRPVVALAKWLAALTALTLALGLPAGYLYFGYQQATGSIQTETRLTARQISQLISSNPDYWQFESIRISEMFGHHSEGTGGRDHRVFAEDGSIVAESSTIPAGSLWPTLTRSEPLLDYGAPVGTLQVTYSLKSIYQATGLIALVSLAIAILVYWGLRVLPLRSLERAWDRLAFLATHDSLTGLPNRVLFIDRLERALSRAQRTNQVVTVHSIDLDRFKDVNDTLGHAAGDALLRQAATRMKAGLRQDDTLARLSGDEFAIVQVDSGKADAASRLAERVIAELSVPFDLSGQEVLVGASVGMATYSADSQVSADRLLKNADLALYKSKELGRGAYHFFEERMDIELQARKAMETDLHQALVQKQFRLHYQPQIDLASQRITGVEALLRWRHPTRGEIPPADFIPIAESSGLMVPISEWVLTTACRETADWAPLGVAINLSADQLTHHDLVPMVKRTLDETGLAPERLELEITEDVLISDTDRTLTVLNALRSLGVRIAMDDFGTGYSSLGYLRRFPFDKIKIDRSFISDIGSNLDAQAIVRAIVGLSRALGIQVNAEGVETMEQASALRSEGCEEVQGFFYGVPMSKTDIEEVLTRVGVVSAASAEDTTGAASPAAITARAS